MALRVDLVLDHGTLVTVENGQVSGPLRGSDQGALGLVHDGAIAIAAGEFVRVGARDAVLAGLEPAAYVDLGGRLATPGLVDAHTHPVWSGSRVDEFAMRVGGADYVAISRAGGGIGATVRATRAASTASLIDATVGRLRELIAHGATTIEAKTGYGLTLDEELRQLEILDAAAAGQPARIVRTFLGAHAVPEEFAGRSGEYVDIVVDQMLPAVAARDPNVFVDVFCDDGAFTLDEARRVLTRAVQLGLPVKVHSDEFTRLGCTALAADLGATSADHLVATTPAEMDALARAGTVAVLLPGTTFGLASSKYAPARELVSRGVPVALGSDFNPGTCPSPDLPLVMALATRYLRLSPAEALVAFTRNAAYSCGRGDVAGLLAPGRPADVAVFDTEDHRDLSYRFGVNPVWGVLIAGAWAVRPLTA